LTTGRRKGGIERRHTNGHAIHAGGVTSQAPTHTWDGEGDGREALELLLLDWTAAGASKEVAEPLGIIVSVVGIGCCLAAVIDTAPRPAAATNTNC